MMKAALAVLLAAAAAGCTWESGPSSPENPAAWPAFEPDVSCPACSDRTFATGAPLLVEVFWADECWSWPEGTDVCDPQSFLLKVWCEGGPCDSDRSSPPGTVREEVADETVTPTRPGDYVIKAAVTHLASRLTKTYAWPVRVRTPDRLVFECVLGGVRGPCPETPIPSPDLLDVFFQPFAGPERIGGYYAADPEISSNVQLFERGAGYTSEGWSGQATWRDPPSGPLTLSVRYAGLTGDLALQIE